MGRLDWQTVELFLPFHCYCTRMDMKFEDVVLDDPDIAKVLIEHISSCGIRPLTKSRTMRGRFQWDDTILGQLYGDLALKFFTFRQDVVEMEMLRLKSELNQTKEMYREVCREALAATQKERAELTAAMEAAQDADGIAA
ncbi:hypothetical protein CRG98_033477 [Punica granatum]|uniref:RING-type E3 ubiquitin transferase n=1 Tax=Punica granatum TaxID=22663 RepID=A0A2I0IQ64_PUNGR|nr:hypothetical protein CRG98_033477 [Punica granatum]